jgi:hypothetical protein
MDSVNIDTLFTNERNECDDYYVILGCDELSNVSIEFHMWLFFSMIVF